MAAPTVVATYTSVQGDGGNIGLAVTTDGTPAAGDYLVVALGVNANADTLTPPAGWTEATVADNVVTSSGGQLRAWYLKNPAASTTYTWSVSTSTRRSIIGVLVRGADGITFVDVAASLETAPGATHTAPSVTTTGADRLIIDFPFHRQFSPDAAGWTAPASGLTWTKHADIQGADSNNNIRLAAGSAAAATAGAVSTAAWTATDTFEDVLILRIAVNPASATASAATPLPIVAVGLAPARPPARPYIGRNTLADDPVLTTKPPIVSTVAGRRSRPNLVLLRSTLADDLVLTTQPPIVNVAPTRRGTAVIWLGRSSLVDSSAPAMTTPAPLVVTVPGQRRPGYVAATRSALADDPVLTTPGPLVIALPARARPGVVAAVRGSLADDATPQPLVVTGTRPRPVVMTVLSRPFVESVFVPSVKATSTSSVSGRRTSRSAVTAAAVSASTVSASATSSGGVT